MDLLTQALLGASVSEAGFRQKLGKRAMGYGAAAGMIPDLDVLVKLSSDPFAEILYHRGFTHSLFFAPLIAPILAYIANRFYQVKKGEENNYMAWLGLFFWALLTHPLLDVFTVYGTQLLAPFSNFRFVFPAVPIVDPFYSGILLVGLLGAIFTKKITASRCLNGLALILTTSYLFWGLEQNSVAEGLAFEQLKKEGVTATKIKAYPTMFQIFLRRVVAHDQSSVYVGFISTRKRKEIKWMTHLKDDQDPIITILKQKREVSIFDWFSSGDYFFTIDRKAEENSIVPIYMRDLRVGYGSTVWGLWSLKIMYDMEKGQVQSITKNIHDTGRIKNDLQSFLNHIYAEVVFD